jgi:Ca-activated chloride channel family protein
MRRMTTLAGWHRAIDASLMAMLRRLGRVIPGREERIRPPILTALIIAVALVGPARQFNKTDNFRNLDGVVIVMDLSRSIVQGGHLADAKAAARYVVDRAGSRPAALVVYAGDAYLVATFTIDAAALHSAIAVLDGNIIPDPGSRPARALTLARQALEDSSVISGDVILVTDGGGIDPAALQEVERIAANGGRVSTLFVPLNPSVAIPDDMPRHEAGVVETLAQLGGGVAGNALFPSSVADAIAAKQAPQLATGFLAVLIWEDYGRYLLVLALVPALALFRRFA